ncbi:hypothetical protein ACJIZ3_019486 [Penstemon smallii]|uniref:Pectinesterase n=1 Tax=Penstemon smallii TaxID=265156 RepID=A0ABD3T1B6_9LAMI
MRFLNWLYFIEIVVCLIILNSIRVCHSQSSFTSLKSLCDLTIYSNTCHENFAPIINDSKTTYNSQLLYEHSVQISINEVSRASKNFSENGTFVKTFQSIGDDKNFNSALESCNVLFSLALHNLNSSLPTSSYKTRDDLITWLSASNANLQTCLDGYEYAPNEVKELAINILKKSRELISNSLAIISKIDHNWIRSSSSSKIARDSVPTWLSSKDRKLLERSKRKIKHDVVVAADGSGNYRTINGALSVVPRNSNTRFVIYVKKGVYHENVKVDVSKWNVLMHGDGMDHTIVSGNLSNADGFSILASATFAVHGKGFIARDMAFQNTAGPSKYQAVALLATADLSIFHRCRIDAYQDTLFTQSNRQFYRECKIYGTIDFIFGDSSVVIQMSTILLKRPLHGQSNVITAQAKNDPNSNTGISIHKCVIAPAEDLHGVRTFLGRPWKDYSTTIFMQNQLGSLIDPKGWLPWGDSVKAPDTIFYAEYNNKGFGAVTKDRVRWKGLKLNISHLQASKFTVRSFINGFQWLPGTGVPFELDL